MYLDKRDKGVGGRVMCTTVIGVDNAVWALGWYVDNDVWAIGWCVDNEAWALG